MLSRLERFLAWGEDLLKRHDRGDEEAEAWVGFVNLTAISIIMIIMVIALQWWLA